MITFEINKTESPFGLLEFAKYVLDYSTILDTRSKMRSLSKAVDAIELAIKSDETKVSMDDEVGNFFKLATENTAYPKMSFVDKDGNPTGPVPNRFFDRLYETVENGATS